MAKRQPAEPPKKRKGRAEGMWRVLSPVEWQQAREEWEADERLSAAYIADKWGVKLKTVKDRITTENWIRRIHKQLAVIPKPRPPWRPTIYRAEFPEMLLEYFGMPAFDITMHQPNEETPARPVIRAAYAFPTLQRFAANIGVHFQRLHEWATLRDADGNLRHPDFADAYARAKTIQAANLIEGGMAEVYQPQFAALAAKNLIGWRQEPEPEDADDTSYPDQAQLNRIYEAAAQKRQQMRQLVAQRRAAAAPKGGPDTVPAVPSNAPA